MYGSKIISYALLKENKPWVAVWHKSRRCYVDIDLSLNGDTCQFLGELGWRGPCHLLFILIILSVFFGSAK